MLLMILIGWVVLLPAIVVAGLYIASSVLGRRRRPLREYDDLLADEAEAGTSRAGSAPAAVGASQADAPEPPGQPIVAPY